MKIVFPEIDYVFDFGIYNTVYTLVIENQRLFGKLIGSIYLQLTGDDGTGVVSEGDKELSFNKCVEMITQFFPFEMNRKSLLGKIYASIEKQAQSEEMYLETAELMSQIETFLFRLTQGFSCDIVFPKINISTLLKASGAEINEDYDSLAEKIVDYFEVVTEFEQKKVFITVNLRSFITDEETKLFIDTILSHGYNVIMIENFEHTNLSNEKRIIVDSDLCVIE